MAVIPVKSAWTLEPITSDEQFTHEIQLSQPHDTGLKEKRKNFQNARLQRSIASDVDAEEDKTKIVGYILMLFLPLLLGAWLIKKKSI